jgi:hypothetical protein
MHGLQTEVPIISTFHRWLIIGCLALMLPGVLLAIDWTVLRPALSGEPFPPTWGWGQLLLVHVVFAFAAWVLVREMLPPLWVDFHHHGIRYLTRRGWRPLAWRDITTIEVKGQRLTLHTADRAVRINIFSYKRPDSVFSYIKHAAPQAVVRTAA